MSEAAAQNGPDRSIIQFLKETDLVGDPDRARFEALAGGVSSDIWKVSSGDSVFCVKRALPKLKVAADWFAPVDRNRFEVAWYRLANRYAPGAAPKVIAADADRMMFAMEYLDRICRKPFGNGIEGMKALQFPRSLLCSRVVISISR